MKRFTIESSAFKTALKRFKDVIRQNMVLPTLECILVEVSKDQIKCTATDLENYLVLNIPATTSVNAEDEIFSFLIPHKNLLTMIANMTPSAITFNIGETSVMISFDRFKAKLPTQHVDHFPKTPTDLGMSVSGSFEIKKWKNALLTAVSFTSNDDLRPQMCGVNFAKENGVVTIVATDAHKLYHKEITGCKLDAEKFNFIMPAKSVRLACTNFSSVADFLVGDNYLRISEDNALLISRKIDARFPDWRQVMPDSEQWPCIYLNRKDVLRGLRVISTFANSATNQVVVSMKAEEQGRLKSVYFDSGDVDFNTEGGFGVYVEKGELLDNHKFALNGKFLQQCLTSSNDMLVKIQFSDSASKCVLINDEILLMPLLIS